MALVHEGLREEIWSRHPPCAKEATECLEGDCSCAYSLRTPELEKQLFCDAVQRPTAEQGLEFFAAASVVLQIGILLISDGHRPGDHTWRALHDFGTRDYESSMVLYGLTNNRGKGHYETVGLFPLINGEEGPRTVNVVCLHSLCKRVGSIGQCVTARPDVLSAALQLYIHTVRQGLSHPCRWTPRLAHGVPEGSKRSHPNNNKHLAAVQCSATTNR